MNKLVLPLIPLLIFSCGSNKDDALVIPTDMPEICRGIDFVTQPDMREVCGVRPARYQSYKNIPAQRYLIQPKNAIIVKKDKEVELRLPNTDPIALPSELASSLEFTQDKRLEYVKNSMVYKEIFPPGQQRIKMFRLGIPSDKEPGKVHDLCFTVPELNIDSRRHVYHGNTIDPLDCQEFDAVIAKFDKK
ncbi:MAG TPA: hypothetical protein VLM37_09765 [Fibrobacteraceae bacterium]|nr:hypothetical protein [Fibrobacteraceae bacterium]